MSFLKALEGWRYGAEWCRFVRGVKKLRMMKDTGRILEPEQRIAQHGALPIVFATTVQKKSILNSIWNWIKVNRLDKITWILQTDKSSPSGIYL